MITVRKLRLVPIDAKDIELNKVYKFIDNEQYNQYKAMNLCMSLLQTNLTLKNYNSGAELKLSKQIENLESKIAKAIAKKENAKTEAAISKQDSIIDGYKEEIEKLKIEYNQASSSRSDIDEKFDAMYVKDLYTVVQSQVNLQVKDNMSLITQRAKKDFTTALKNGMARGERSLTTYKRDYPLMVRGRDLKSYYDGEDVYIKWIKGIVFKVVLGRKDKNYKELQHTLHEVIVNQELEVDKRSYKICDSSMGFVSNKLILNLTLDIKTSNKNEFKEGRVVGVDLRINIPAYVSLSDVSYIKRALGSEDRLIDTAMQMKHRLRRLQREVSYAKSGKGRAKKTKALEMLRDKEANFRKTFQHKISKDIIEFAKQNNAGQINLEFLSLKDSKNSFILQNWGYYQLQQMIEYKAERAGIEVKYIDPYHTSQTCSKCGHYEEGQRETQEKFICKSCGFSVNADYNASRNIAMSTKYISSKEDSEYYKLKKLEIENNENIAKE